VVVGAGPGLGLATARRFAAAGFPIGLVARSSDSLNELSQSLAASNVTVATAAADVTNNAALTDALVGLSARLGGIDTVLFSPRPSMDLIKPVLDTTPEDMSSALELSVTAAVTVARVVVPDMLSRASGGLLFTTGGAAVDPHRDRAASAVAYAAESAYVRLLHDQLAPAGVHVSQVTIVGPIGPGLKHEPDQVADLLWRSRHARSESLTVLR